MYIIESPLDYPWYYWVLLIMCIIPVIVFVDIVFVMPSDLKYQYDKNPFMRKVQRDLKQIKKLSSFRRITAILANFNAEFGQHLVNKIKASASTFEGDSDNRFF